MGIKTLAKQATSAQTAVDPADATMRKLADATRHFVQFQDVMTTIWSRINSPGKEYLHIQKGLYVLQYLLVHGSEQVLTESRVHQPEISTLTDFHCKSAQPDNGGVVRERAHAVMKLLNNEELLQEKRAEARR